MTQYKAPTKRFEVLDTFRGIAAIIVAIYQYTISDGLLRGNPLISHGHRFVGFFFVLSGFIIYFNYRNLSDFTDQKKFIVKRIWRLYPLHFFTLFLFLLFEVFKAILYKYGFFNSAPFTKNNLEGFIANLLLLQGIVDDYTQFTWNYPSWSISVEFINYILFAALLPVINKLGRHITPISFLIISLWALILMNYNPKPFEYVLKCTYGFFLGCTTFFAYKAFFENIQFSKSLIHILEFFSAALMIILICFLPETYSNLLSPFYCVIILIFAREGGIVSNFLKNKILLLLGTLSYSIYMTHALIANVLKVGFINILKLSGRGFDYSIIVFLITVIIFSYFTYHTIEVKSQFVLRRRYGLAFTKDKA